jgi:hypothetical protein
MGAAEQPGKPALLPAMAPEELRDVDFRSLDPASQGVATDAPLLCPVTRRELRPGDPIYQCRACRTSYSLAGWQFLRDVDRGRCCACGQQKTVYPLA